ncbi:MAG: hypothetical protein LAP40_14565 [Acidobacteriia bacterium]|nr:hypothetical protein [Terriglobia bacterium]
MSRSGIGVLGATVALALAWTPLASAQSPANLAIVSGSGQLMCPTCASSSFIVFEPLVVRVTDAAGNPVPNTQVNWTVNARTATSVVLTAVQSTTDPGGKTSNTALLAAVGSRLAHQVVASLPGTNVSVTFYLTQGAPQSAQQYAFAFVSGLYATLIGSVGTTASGNLQVQVQDFLSQPVPNVSVRLIPAPGYTPGASISCATGNGADPGSILTDANGSATCTPVFGPFPSASGTTGSYHVLVGGVAAAQLNGSGPIGYQEFGTVFIQVTPGTPGAVSLVSGDQQSGAFGKSLAAPLVAQIQSSAGVALAGQAVTWSVTPTGAATLSQTSTISDVNGQVATAVTLAPSATGVVKIQVTTANNVSSAFTVNVISPLTGLSKASGDGQSAPLNTAFAQPLVVQVSAAAGQPVSNIPVSFSISGPGTLNNTNVSTDSSGRAAVAVTSGSKTGTITVTATAGAYSVVFTLTAAVSGPVLTSANFLNGAGFYATDASHSALAPCGIGTIIAPGIAPNVQGIVTGPTFGPLPYQLGQVTVSFNNSQSPLYNVANVNGQQQVAFQVPCDVVPAQSVPATVTVAGLSTIVNVVVRSAGPGIFQYNMSDGALRAVLVRPDGSFVSLENPAQHGEQIRIFATGIGQVLPSLPTNGIPVPLINSNATGKVSVSLNDLPMTVLSARRAPDLIGVDEVVFQIPFGAPTGNDIPLQLVVTAVDNPQNPQYSNISKIPIQ